MFSFANYIDRIQVTVTIKIQRYRIIKVGLFSVRVSTSLSLIIAIHHALDITSRKSHMSTVKGLALHEFPRG